MGEYGLGIDLGSRFTAAAITAGGAVEAVRLGGRRSEIPTAVFLRPDGTALIGEGARRRGESEPSRLAGDLPARLTADDPVRLGDAELSGPALVAQFLDQVIARASRGRAGRLTRVVLTHPAGADPGYADALRRAADLAGLPEVVLHSDAAAAAARARPGELVAVYDLGATFRATVLRRTDEGAELLATERAGGVDFDRLVYEQVLARFEPSGEAPADLARLRRECAEAVESLSFDTEAEIAVDLPGVHTRVTYRRPELEKLISPALGETVAALRRAFTAAGVRADEADSVILAGGSSRIPLVGALVSAAIGRSVPPGEQPETAVAMGAARLSLPGADLAVSVAFPAIVMPPVGSSPIPSPAAESPAESVASASSPGAATEVVAPVALAGAPAEPVAEDAAPAASAEGAAPVAVPEASTEVAGPGGRSLTAASTEVVAPGGRSLTAASTELVVVRPSVDAEPPTQLLARRRRGPIWTYRWPIAVGLAGILVAAAVTAVALWSGRPPSPVASPVAGPTTPPVALLWKNTTGSGATEPPAISGDRVVLSGADGKLRGYRRDDGSLAWSAPVGAGARVAAGVPGRQAYATTADGHLVAVDTGTGETVWRRSAGTTFGARPVAGAGRIYASGRDGVLYAYASSGDHTRWRVWLDDRLSGTPALAGTVAVAYATVGRLYGTDRDGTPIWNVTVGAATSGPVAVAGVACLPLADGTVRCARADTGELLPAIRQDGTQLMSITGGAGLLFAAGSDGSVSAWEPLSGRQLWIYRPPAGAITFGGTRGSGGSGGAGRPMDFAGRARRAGSEGAGLLLVRTGEVDVAYPGGRLAGLDLTTGGLRWQYAVPERLAVAPAGDDGGIFLLGSSGTLYALRPPGIAAGLGASPTVAPLPTTRPPAGDEPPVHRRPTASTSAPPPSGPSSEPPSSEPPTSEPPSSEPPASGGPPGGL